MAIAAPGKDPFTGPLLAADSPPGTSLELVQPCKASCVQHPKLQFELRSAQVACGLPERQYYSFTP